MATEGQTNIDEVLDMMTPCLCQSSDDESAILYRHNTEDDNSTTPDGSPSDAVRKSNPSITRKDAPLDNSSQ